MMFKKPLFSTRLIRYPNNYHQFVKLLEQHIDLFCTRHNLYLWILWLHSQRDFFDLQETRICMLFLKNMDILFSSFRRRGKAKDSKVWESDYHKIQRALKYDPLYLNFILILITPHSTYSFTKFVRAVEHLLVA